VFKDFIETLHEVGLDVITGITFRIAVFRVVLSVISFYC